MKDVKYKISLYSYWHAGGKDGANMEIDNAVIKDKYGLPFLGGKTLKGLIKDGARFVNKHQKEMVNDEFITSIFGEADESYDTNNQNNFTSSKLCQNVDSANVKYLYHKKASTAIEPNKQAQKHSLRTMEVAIPLELEAGIENFTGDIKMLKLSFKAVKKLGEKRFRGLGRCVFEVSEIIEKK